MDDNEILAVQRAVSEFLQMNWAGFWHEEPRALFKQLVAFIGAEDANDEHLTVAAMSALGPDPDQAGPPPAEMRRDLLAEIRKAEPELDSRRDRVWEFVIAYGCGWKRSVAPGKDGWENHWPNAVLALNRLMDAYVRMVDQWLIGLNIGYPEGPNEDPEDIRCPELAMHMVTPEKSLSLHDDARLEVHCHAAGSEVLETGSPAEYSIPPGSKFIFECRRAALYHGDDKQVQEVPLQDSPYVTVLSRDDDVWVTRKPNDDGPAIPGRITLVPEQWLEISGPGTAVIWECTCGNRNCRERHRIESWNPRYTLWAFLATAVKGPGAEGGAAGQVPIMGAAVQGMYLPLLARQGGFQVRTADVLSKRCPADHFCPDNTCMICGNIPYPETRVRNTAAASLIVAGVFPAVFERVQRIRCGKREEHYRRIKGLGPADEAPPPNELGEKWDNLYERAGGPENQEGCPICEQQPNWYRATTVWIPTLRHVVPLDLNIHSPAEE